MGLQDQCYRRAAATSGNVEAEKTENSPVMAAVLKAKVVLWLRSVNRRFMKVLFKLKFQLISTKVLLVK